jgi:hypothetical protein
LLGIRIDADAAGIGITASNTSVQYGSNPSPYSELFPTSAFFFIPVMDCLDARQSVIPAFFVGNARDIMRGDVRSGTLYKKLHNVN